MAITIALIIASYLLGSICTAILVCKALGFPDPRSEGSSNPGTTNVLRIAGKGPAALTLLGDILKCVIPVLIGHALNLPWLLLGFVGLAAFMGHLFPIFFRFEGGKGVATAFGFALALDWQFGLVCVLCWVSIAAITRYSSLAALVTWTLAPFLAWYLVDPELVFSLAPMSAMLVYRHKENILKLKNGTESKIGKKKEEDLGSEAESK
jgi:glycerol-3-phosphate acyltransferase PlsY